MVEAFQNPWEFDHLLALVEREKPRRILEIGAMYGGTLQHWLKIADSVVVVDDRMLGAQDWERWADVEGTDLSLIQGASQNPSVVSTARKLGPYDFVFIDADHTYDSVSADWNNYGVGAPMVALHDILPRPNYGVSQVWESLRDHGAKWVEICHYATLPGNEGPCGIGVVWQ